MKIIELAPNIIQYTADSVYELCSTFVRLQEFYESPFDDIRGKFFSLDTFMDLYAENNHDNFTYFEDWHGFNIPGSAVVKFVEVFAPKHQYANPLRDKEYKLLTPLRKFYDVGNTNFYIIGNVAGQSEVVAHELRHAYYYLNPIYKAQCDEVYGKLPDAYKEFLHNGLVKLGYHESVFPDEVQAYLGSSSMEEIVDIFGKSPYHKQEILEAFREIKTL